jgi:hypothetical protein
MDKLSCWWCNNHLEKYESQWEGYGKNVPAHQPVIILIQLLFFSSLLQDLDQCRAIA